jgi:hypothetical protein
MILIANTAPVRCADPMRAWVLNEDSHPHSLAPGEAARFSLEVGEPAALMDVKCSLAGDEGQPPVAVTLRTHGLAEVRWPYPSRTIHVERRIDFDILAHTLPDVTSLPYFEFVNEDPSHRLWHQCYNN